MMRHKHVITILCLLAALGSLAACCVKPVYDETPTAGAQAASPTATTAVAPTSAPPTETPTPIISGPPMLRMEPSVVLDFPIGETRQVQILLDNVERLNELEIHISFEPRYISIQDADAETEGVQIQAGSFPKPTHIIQNEAQNDAGLIVYHVAQEANTRARGSGVVASLTVQALAEGGSPLRFTIVKLMDPQGEQITIPERMDGLVTISSGEDEAVETTAVPTAVTAPTAPAATAPPSGEVRHTVQAGENLYRISLRYGTTVDAIVAANGLTDASAIRVGQVLVIPTGGGGTGAKTYVVQPGDTLYSIAKRYGMTVEELAALNGISDTSVIKVGQTLKIAP